MKIITTNTVWSANAPLVLTDDVQIAAGVTLTIGPGASVRGNGHSISAFGALSVDNAVLKNVDIGFGRSDNSNGRIDIRGSELDGGTFLPAGSSGHGSFSVTDTLFRNSGPSQAWYPTADSTYARNVFYNSAGLSIGFDARTNGTDVTVADNIFIDWTPNIDRIAAAVTSWAAYGSSLTVRGNDFVGSGQLALSLQYESGSITAPDNFFGAVTAPAIAALIRDRNDDLSLSSTVDFVPFRTSMMMRSGPLVFTGSEGRNALEGNSRSNVMFGLGGNDTLKSGRGADIIYGGDGNDLLDGGQGADVIYGGKGNDTYVVDALSDNVREFQNEGTDTVVALSSYILPFDAQVEILQLSSATNTSPLKLTGNLFSQTLIGNKGANVLAGGGDGGDRLIGGQGNDTYIVGSFSNDMIVEKALGGVDLVQSSKSFSLANIAEVENIFLIGPDAVNATGNSLSNMLTGNSLANMLDGGRGNDRLIGGAGNDTYIVDSPADIVQEATNRGADEVWAYSSYRLANGLSVEKLIAHPDADKRAFTFTGNELNNEIVGGSANDKLNGGLGADTLEGRAGSDILDVGIDKVRDTVVIENPSHSSGLQRDVVINFNFNSDKLDIGVTPFVLLPNVTNGALNTRTFDDDLGHVVDQAFQSQIFPGGAALFDPSSGTLNKPGHVYLVVDANFDRAYTPGSDFVIQFVNSSGNLDLTDFLL